MENNIRCVFYSICGLPKHNECLKNEIAQLTCFEYSNLKKKINEKNSLIL